jgi:hypothetical protein
MQANQLKAKWNYFAQLSIFILTLAGSFLVTPPLLSFDAENRITPFARFMIAGLLALLFIPLAKRNTKRYYTIWYRTAIAFFVAAILSVILYAKLLHDWSVPFYGGQRLVIGKHMYASVVNRKLTLARELNKPMIDNELLVKSFQGNPSLIWPAHELRKRLYLLTALYILSVTFVGCFVVTVIQSIYCYEYKQK